MSGPAIAVHNRPYRACVPRHQRRRRRQQWQPYAAATSIAAPSVDPVVGPRYQDLYGNVYWQPATYSPQEQVLVDCYGGDCRYLHFKRLMGRERESRMQPPEWLFATDDDDDEPEVTRPVEAEIRSPVIGETLVLYTPTASMTAKVYAVHKTRARSASGGILFTNWTVERLLVTA